MRGTDARGDGFVEGEALGAELAEGVVWLVVIRDSLA
jgi:hypothetical protein